MNKLKETITSIKFIQEARNKVAHWDLKQTEKDGVFLVKRSLILNDNEFRLSDKFMIELDIARLKVMKGITDFLVDSLNNKFNTNI